MFRLLNVGVRIETGGYSFILLSFKMYNLLQNYDLKSQKIRSFIQVVKSFHVVGHYAVILHFTLEKNFFSENL